ncbi:MAG: hypothetical protein WCV85_01280 [Patescibacteria group bacterium]
MVPISNEAFVKGVSSCISANLLSFLQNLTTEDAYGTVANLLTRGGNMDHIPGNSLSEKHEEISGQARLLALILLPIKVQRNGRLPVISRQDINTVFDRGIAGEWEPTVLLQEILEANIEWYVTIQQCASVLHEESQFSVFIVAQAFISKIAEKVEDETRENESSIERQLRDILGPQAV